MNILLFEDQFVSQLYPITLARPAYLITCASYHLLDLVRPLAKNFRSVVRPHLAELQKEYHPELHQTELDNSQPCLILNSAVVPSITNLEKLKVLIQENKQAIIKQGDRLLAVYLKDSAKLPAIDCSVGQLDDYFKSLPEKQIERSPIELNSFLYPHDVVRFNLDNFSENIESRLHKTDLKQTQDGVFQADDVSLGEHLVFDTSAGPIIIESGASIGPYCFLRGPAYLGKNVKVIEHAAIKDAVSLGHTTKIGGEVEASVIEPYSNKQHHGFLGHSYLGSWINLGAGTSNSDLKNTYGQVKMEYKGQRVSTDMQFIGSIFGDYAKTAINTGIFTGKTIGVCSMLYGFVTTNVPSFVNYARLFGQVTELPPEVMISTQQRMFARRKVMQRPCDIQLLHDMYLLTQDERQLAGEPLAL